MTPDQQAALEKPLVREVYFVEFHFQSGIQRACNMNQTITWGGHQWLGLGAIGGISAVEESDSLESKPLNFTLNAADLSWLAIAVGPVEEYQGRPAKMYFSPLNESYQLIDEPVLCWSGIMDMVTAGMDQDGEEATGQIVLKCEGTAYGLKRSPALRMNDAQQRARHPNDRGFEYLNDLIANPQLWMSKKFQMQ